MKTLRANLPAFASFIFFPMLIIFRKKRKTVYILLCFLMATLSSCFLNFYRTNTKPSISTDTISKLNSEHKHFIIHFSNSINELKDVYIANDSIYGKVLSI